MGYYVNIRECNIRIRSTSFKDACQHLLDTGFLTDWKNMSGKLYSGEQERVVELSYAWVNMDDLKDCLERGDLTGAFMCFGFEVELAENGDIEYLQYSLKSGNEEHLLGNLAQFFDADNYIEWEGEEKEIWRNHFANGKMYFQDPITVWSNIQIYDKED